MANYNYDWYDEPEYNYNYDLDDDYSDDWYDEEDTDSTSLGGFLGVEKEEPQSLRQFLGMPEEEEEPQSLRQFLGMEERPVEREAPEFEDYAPVPVREEEVVEAPKREGSSLGAFGRTLSRIPENLAAKAIMAVQGQEGASVADRGIADRFVNWVDDRNRQLAEDYEGTGDFIPGVVSKKDLAELGPNLAFSGVSMGGTVGGGAAGGLVGAPGGPLAIGSTIAGGLAGGAAAAYRMDAYQVMNDKLEQANEESIAKGLGPISKEEEERFKAEISDIITEHGAWEAGPEAIGNMVDLALMTAKNLPGVRWVPKNIAGKAIKGAMRFGGILGTEEATETVTGMGQQQVEAKLGLTDEEPREWTSGDDWVETAKEVFPQVLLLSGFMGAGGAAYRSLRGSAAQPTDTSPTDDEQAPPPTTTDISDQFPTLTRDEAKGMLGNPEGLAAVAGNLGTDVNTLVEALELKAMDPQNRAMAEKDAEIDARIDAKNEEDARKADEKAKAEIEAIEQAEREAEEVVIKQAEMEAEAQELAKQEALDEEIVEKEDDYLNGDVDLTGVTVDVEAKLPDGEIVKETRDAKTALEDVTKRREMFDNILNCLSG